MKVTSSPYSIDWSDFRPSPPPKPGVDVAALQKRLDPWRDNPLRYLRGTFRCPREATSAQRTEIMADAVKVFVLAMAKQGWEQHSRIQILDSPYEAHAGPESTDPVMPDYQEYIARGVFQKIDLKPVRIELPPDLVKELET